MRSKWLGLVIVAAMALLGAGLYSLLPDQVPSHWNIAGEVDGYLSQFWGAWLLPLIGLGLWGIFEVLPLLDPKGANYAQFSGTYQVFRNLLLVFLALVYLATLAVALGWQLPITRLITVGSGLLLAGLGNELGRVQPNWFVGIRTPWTMASPAVWQQTHRFAARLMVGVGLLVLLAAVFLPEGWLYRVVISITLGFALASITHSYVAWRRIHNHQDRKAPSS